MNITFGKIKKAKKVVIYGVEGIGKSTFAAQFPEPLFIDTEGSTKELDVNRFDKPTSWEMIKNQVEYVKQAKPCKTLVIDTADWAERLCIESVCFAYNKKGIEDFGYGNGYTYVAEEFGKFLNKLEDIIECGINVVLTAHAQIRKFELPNEQGAFDKYELKLGKKTTNQIAPMVKEWADMVLFANYKVFTIATDDKGTKHKAQGGQRVMYTSHHPCWDAKNRYGLLDELPFNYAEIKTIIEDQIISQPAQPPKATNEAHYVDLDVVEDDDEPAPVPTPKSTDEYEGIPKALADLMKIKSVTQKEIRAVVAQKGYYPFDTEISAYDESFVKGCLISAWNSVFEEIEKLREVPFN